MPGGGRWGWGNESNNSTSFLLLKTHYVPGIVSSKLRLLAHHILLTLKSGYYHYLFISHKETAFQWSGNLPK